MEIEKFTPKKFVGINHYVHAYHIPGLHNLLSNYRDEFRITYSDNISSNRKTLGTANVNLENEKLKKNLDGLLYRTTKKFYVIGKRWEKTPFGIYVQDNEDSINQFHSHFQASLVATLYLDPIENESGGELEIVIPPSEPLKIIPRKDYIYFIPGWLLHRPLPQKRKTPRFCLNWVYTSNRRPIHKLTGERW